ncbi:hypothetical protein DB30_08144 [Enhygromyxa salina]|uniref:Uncharacterized protein n=1 Tax=Enhygromyxa salina TaxID=215803 RepID=A0A0C2CZT0_9BACT|nr:hypothetical protein DB30_08144 [Enhygromyxa salina]
MALRPGACPFTRAIAASRRWIGADRTPKASLRRWIGGDGWPTAPL